jgi:23S rRNA (cytosine1962-C5)-methyltransferase
MQIWRLKKGSEKKFKSGHPWVFSSELAQSPKDLPAGELVELQDHENKFLAYGYGHPQSQISFRTLSTNRKETIDAHWFAARFKKNIQLRRIAGVAEASHRLCFAEGDQMPGLIIDCYRCASPVVLENTIRDIFVVQVSTAGMERLWPVALEGLREFVIAQNQGRLESWEQTAVVLSNDSKARLLEGLQVEPKRQIHGPSDLDLSAVEVLIQAAHSGLAPTSLVPTSFVPTSFVIDILGGQKTGFFLDQRSNVQIMATLLGNLIREKNLKQIKILDLCCYVGQWGASLAHFARTLSCDVQVTAVDASTKALALSQFNVEKQGASCEVFKMDVLQDLPKLPDEAFDVVICDPPAFIKKKKDFTAGQGAYFKMNREALRKVKVGGLFVSCSCSGLLTEEDFRQTLAAAWAAAGADPRFRWLARGSHSADHPQRPEFPQGSYLKSWFAIRTEA